MTVKLQFAIAFLVVFQISLMISAKWWWFRAETTTVAVTTPARIVDNTPLPTSSPFPSNEHMWKQLKRLKKSLSDVASRSVKANAQVRRLAMQKRRHRDRDSHQAKLDIVMKNATQLATMAANQKRSLESMEEELVVSKSNHSNCTRQLQNAIANGLQLEQSANAVEAELRALKDEKAQLVHKLVEATDKLDKLSKAMSNNNKTSEKVQPLDNFGFQNMDEVYEFWSKKDHTTLKNIRVSPSMVLNKTRMDACHNRRFVVGQDKFDIVVSWINMSETGYHDWPPRRFERARGRPYAGIGHDRPPNSEIVFALRSLHKHGVMKHVNKIFILYDDQKQGPPQFLNDWQTVVRPVPHTELVGGTVFVDRVRRFQTVLAFVQHIHGLSEHFLFLNDDVLLMQDFDPFMLVDRQSGKMRHYMG